MMQEDEFRQIYDAYYADVYRFVRGLVNRESDVEDVVQNVFLQVARRHRQFRGDAKLRTWILAIAKNAVMDLWRSQKSRSRFDGPDIDSLPESAWSSSLDADPGQVVLRREEASAVRACIDSLPANMKMVLHCRALMELSAEETADLMGWTSSRVRVTYMRAVRKFRERWSEPPSPLPVRFTEPHSAQIP